MSEIYTNIALEYDDETELLELRENMNYLGMKKPRKYSRDDFIDVYMDELNNTFGALKEYLDFYTVPILQNMDFGTFCNFCYLYSNKSK